MKTLPVAVQVYSVREDAQKDFKATIKKLKEMGYDGVELAGFYDYTPIEIKKILDEAELKAISAHVPFDAFAKDLEKTIDDYKLVGCEYIALPYMADNMRPKNCDFNKTLDEIRRIGKACNDKGIVLAYHNHDFEFEKMDDGSYMLDYIYSNISADLLKVQPDICWILVSGVNPSEYIRKYSGRCPVVHLKDFIGNKTETMYDLIGQAEKEKKGEAFQFKPVGSGKQDIPSVLQASIDAGAKWVVVEQDMSLAQPMLEAVKESRDYLKTLGW